MVSKKRLFFALFILLILIIGFFVSSQEKEKISEEVYEELEENKEAGVIIILKEPSTEEGFLFKTEKTDEEINLEKQEIKEEIINKIDEENVKHVFDDYIAASISEDSLEKLNENSNIKSIEIDKPIKAFLQDSVPMINASTVWPIKLSGINITGTDETVCILDTGINFSHSDLLGKNKTCIIDCVSKSCVENCSISDDNGHGTHVAGIVAASESIKGVAIGANLIGVKVLDSAGSGSSSDLDAGISWCINNAALYNISVISMSLGTEAPDLYSNYCDSSFTTTASRINNATSRNISVIAATGNDGNVTHIASPACIRNATAVGSIRKDDSTFGYNRNNITDLIATGYLINSTRWSGSSCLSGCSCSGNYMICSGTSMAAPHVAGAFALIRQFYKLQNNRVPTPSEILNISNSTGKIIYDSSSNRNFSRINIYSALVSIDANSPSVNLTLPSNASIQNSNNVTFGCSASDVLLKNITLYVWNSSGVYNTTVREISGINTNQEFNLTNISYGDYKWNCLAYDSKGNFSFASSNFSLTISQIIVSLNSPLNNLFTNQNQTFNCSAETATTKKLTNLTLYIWNSTALVYNISQNTSGASNFSIFQYNFTREGNYSWNCKAYNNNSESAWANNFTITYDVTKPSMTLISPENSISYTSSSQEITFQYNVSDTNLANCSLITNNMINLTNSSINQSQTQSFTQTFSPASYSWQINCSDKARNQENSSSRSFTITAPQIVTTSSGGGGAGSTVSTYTISNEQASGGYTKEINKDDKIKFNILNAGKEEQHTLIVEHVGKDFVNLSIQSDVTKLVLKIGQSIKLNLTSADYYDLYIELNSIISNKANLTIKTIYEEIPIISISGEATKEAEKETQATELPKETGEKEEKPLKISIMRYILIIVVFIAVILILLLRKLRKKGKVRK